MDFKTFISRLEEVRDIGRIENGYSHIVYNVMYDHVLDSEKYMLVDVSTYWRTKNKHPINEEFLGKDLCAVPDFVITKKTKKLSEIGDNRLGCIEVKFHERDLDGKRLSNEENKIGYLEMYNNHVIYTNGWIWKYYGEKPWIVDFTKEEKRTQKTYDELISKLKTIKWNK